MAYQQDPYMRPMNVMPGAPGGGYDALEAALRNQQHRAEVLQRMGLDDGQLAQANNWAGRQLQARSDFRDQVREGLLDKVGLGLNAGGKDNALMGMAGDALKSSAVSGALGSAAGAAGGGMAAGGLAAAL